MDWSSANWNLRDRELAASLGFSRQYVHLMRRKHGHPPVRWWETVDWRLSNVQLAAQTGLTRGAVADARSRLGRPASPRTYAPSLKYDWASVDWRLSDSEIARSLG